MKKFNVEVLKSTKVEDGVRPCIHKKINEKKIKIHCLIN